MYLCEGTGQFYRKWKNCNRRIGPDTWQNLVIASSASKMLLVLHVEVDVVSVTSCNKSSEEQNSTSTF